VRDAAAVTQCQNNLKQLALACHNYADTHDGALPPGTSGGGSAPEQRFGCFMELLPYIEQDNLYKSLDRAQSWQSAANREAVDKPVKTFCCPSADPERPNHTSYVGIAGDGVDAATLPPNDVRRGFFGYARAVKLKDVSDGISSTLLFLETRRDTGPWAAGGAATVRGIDRDDDPLVGKGGAFGDHTGASRWNFGRVPTRATAAMGDGSVKVVPGSVSADVLAALATIAGGEEVDLAW
jgi:hypothetical protein